MSNEMKRLIDAMPALDPELVDRLNATKIVDTRKCFRVWTPPKNLPKKVKKPPIIIEAQKEKIKEKVIITKKVHVRKRRASRKLYTTFLLETKEWTSFRSKILKERPNMCVRCQSTDSLQLDHISPKSKFPFLTFDPNNIQILCQRCNFRKRREEE